MTTAAPLAFPGGRVLAGWWRQLAPAPGTEDRQAGPRALWVGRLLLHRVETLVRVSRPQRPDTFTLLILGAVAETETATVPAIDARLHLGPDVLGQTLRRLGSEGLTWAGTDGAWKLTPLGQEALDRGEYRRLGQERRAFHFVDRRPGPATPEPAAFHFLNLRLPAGVSAAAPEGWEFDPRALQTCLGQPPEWKQAFGFPEEVEHIYGLGAERTGAGPAETPPAWQQVILDRPEHLLTVFVLVSAPPPGEAAAGGQERLLGFAVRQEGWVLQAEEPAFTLTQGWTEVFPELGEEPAPEAWRQAWRSWCQPRSLPAAEYDACKLERQEYRLRVLAPKRLVDRLRAARSDALKGEAWVLAGTGNLRPAALLEIVEV
jgi:hypothetical protein